MTWSRVSVSSLLTTWESAHSMATLASAEPSTTAITFFLDNSSHSHPSSSAETQLSQLANLLLRLGFPIEFLPLSCRSSAQLSASVGILIRHRRIPIPHAFPSSSETCAECELELTQAANRQDYLRATKMEQRQRHEQLYLGKSIGVLPQCKYFLVPSLWIASWKAYLAVSGRNVSTAGEPGNLEHCIDSLLCKKHFRLLYRPPELVRKRGEFVQRTSNVDVFTIVTEKDWDFFCQEWNVPESKSISVVVEFTNDEVNDIVGSCKEMPISVDGLNGVYEEPHDDFECKMNRIPMLRTQPEICEQCLEERESRELMRKLEYSDEEIRVFLIRGKEPPRSVLAASGAVTDAERRTSKRSRKTSTNGSSINLKVSGCTSVYQLKMMIWESFGVVKENQKLHKGTSELTDELATLADLNIFPGDSLWVTDTEMYENRDIAEELSEQEMENEQVEEGFKGTLLTSSVPAF